MSTSEQISFSKHHSHFKLEALLQVKFFSAKYKFVAEETFKGQNCNINIVKPLEIYFTLKVAVQKNTVEESSNLCTPSLFCQIEHLMEGKGALKKRGKCSLLPYTSWTPPCRYGLFSERIKCCLLVYPLKDPNPPYGERVKDHTFLLILCNLV